MTSEDLLASLVWWRDSRSRRFRILLGHPPVQAGQYQKARATGIFLGSFLGKDCKSPH